MNHQQAEKQVDLQDHLNQITCHGSHGCEVLYAAKGNPKVLRSKLLVGFGTYCVTCYTSLLKACSRPTVLGLRAKGKTDMYTRHGLQTRHALQHSSFAAPPGSCDLLSTAGPTRQGDDTPTLSCWKKSWANCPQCARALKAPRAVKDTATDELTERSNPSGWGSSYPVLC